MKKAAFASLILALLVPATAALAQSKMDDMKGMDMAKKPAAIGFAALDVAALRPRHGQAGPRARLAPPHDKLRPPAQFYRYLGTTNSRTHVGSTWTV